MNSYKRITLSALLGVAWSLPHVAGAAVLTPNALWDASADGDAVWDVITSESRFDSLDWSLSGVDHVAVSGSDFDIFTDAYEWGAGDTGVAPSFQDAGVQSDTFSLEMYFRPDSLSGGSQILFESGGTSFGSSLLLEDNILSFVSRDRNNGESSLSATLPSSIISDFVQATVVMDVDGSNVLSLYVNGVNGEQLDESVPTAVERWTGGNDSGLGNVGGGAPGGPSSAFNSLVSYQGEIALIRYYDIALTQEQVRENFTSTLGDTPEPPDPTPVPLPGGIALYGLGLAVLGWFKLRPQRT